MDGSRFDQIARGMATGSSRRTMLKGLGGGVLAALGLARAGGGADAKPKDDQQGCKRVDKNCKRDDQCCGGLVCEADACKAGCHIAGAFVAPGASPPGNPCLVCVPAISTTTGTNNDGAACNDGNACTLTDICQGGVCVGGNPVVCTALDACHDVGVCDTTSGQCTNPAKSNGTSCSDGNACTQTDTCQDGVCTGANPVVCAPPDQCHTGVCDETTGECVYQAKTDGTPCQGADLCLQNYDCQAGVCVGSEPVVCTASDECHVAGTCNPATGACSNPSAVSGTLCADPACEGAVLQTFTCDGQGTCVQSGTDCTPYTCDPDSATCLTSCTGDDACAPGAHCVDGACCPAEDFCQFEEVCCDPGRSPTAKCCPAGGCCECFSDPGPGTIHPYLCCDEEKICGGGQSGYAPGKLCCHNDENCIDGDCCHVTFTFEGGCCDRPTCGGVCCSQGTECVNDVCVAEGRTCDPNAAENPNCFAGEVCDFGAHICCPEFRSFQVTYDIDGVPTIANICCPYGQGPCISGAGCCSAPDFGSTFRGSITRP